MEPKWTENKWQRDEMEALVVFGGEAAPVGTNGGKMSEILVMLASRVPFWKPSGAHWGIEGAQKSSVWVLNLHRKLHREV